MPGPSASHQHVLVEVANLVIRIVTRRRRRRRLAGHNVDAGRGDYGISVPHGHGRRRLGVPSRWILDAPAGGGVGVMFVMWAV